MRTPAWEDGDLLYRPTPYEIDGTHRVQANGDQTLLSWARPTPWFISGELVGAPGDGLAKFHHLRNLVEEHDWSWLSLGSSTLSPQQRAWVDGVWRPWSRRWHEFETAGRFFEMDFSVSETLLREIAQGLSALREEAAAHGVPVPDIGSGRLGLIRDGWDSQRDPAYQAALRQRSALPTLTSGTIEDFRREVRRALATPREPGPEDGDVQAVGVLLWHGKEWVTPFPSLERARAYFDHARGIGIDFDYGAYFDVSDPQHPILAWEWLGQGPSKIAGSLERSPAHTTDLRYHVAANAGASMNIPLIGRRGGGGGAHAAHATPMAAHGHGRPAHHGHGRRFLGGWGWGGWDDDSDAYGDPYAYSYPWWIYGAAPGEPSGVSIDEEEFEVSSGDYLRNPRRSLVARDDLRGAADVLSPGGAGLHCELNFGSDMILRASICVDGQCYQGAADLSRLLHDIHARLHGVDVTEEVIGRSGRRRHHHRRHRHHHHHQQQQPQEQEEQEGQGGQEGGQGFPGQGFQGQGYPPPYPPYPYPYPQPYPPQPYPPYPQPVASIAPAVAPVVVTPTVAQAPAPTPVAAPLPAAALAHTRDHRHRDVQADAQTQQAVQASGELLIGALYNQHCQEVSAGWLDSIGDAFSGAWHAVAQTIQKYKGPITVAATAVAKAYGGETSGQLASQLTGPVIDAAAGSGDRKQQAQQVVAIATQAAQTQPKIAAALSAAQTAAAQTAAAYHVTSTAIDALRGNPEAMGKLDQLRADAASGDPAARRALDLVTLALQSMRGQDSGASGAGGGTNGANGDQVGGLLPWLGLAALGGGAYWWWSHRQRARERARQAAQQAAAQAAAEHAASPPPLPPPSPQGSSTTTSGEIELAKADAVAAVQALRDMDPSITYFGYVRQRSSTAPSELHFDHPVNPTLVIQDTSVVNPLATIEDLWAWYQQHTADPASYEFVALFDASRPKSTLWEGWPHPFLAHESPPNPGRVVTSPAHHPDHHEGWTHS